MGSSSLGPGMEEKTAPADWELRTGAGTACVRCQPVETDEAVHQAATSGHHADLALCLLKGRALSWAWRAS